MTKIVNSPRQSSHSVKGGVPTLQISKVGIVSRDYGKTWDNGYRDLSHSLHEVLKLLDSERCDAALFSSLSVVPRASFDLKGCFKKLRHIKAVFLEEFKDGKKRRRGRYLICYKKNGRWEEYDECNQQFSSLTRKTKDEMREFVHKQLPKRVLGNCCVLLCGESNGVKYSPKDKKVLDPFGLAKAIPKKVHD
jgi:hypothetical protein